jgi:hypothetical protein
VLPIRNRAGRAVELDYDDIVFADFEFYAPPGERPQVVCLAWYQFTTGITRSLWHDELGPLPPYRTDGRVLFVCFVANAEIGCHLALGWPVPIVVRVFVHAERWRIALIFRRVLR